MGIRPEDPPLKTTEAGKLRRVGVEIEFADIDCARAAEVALGLFGGHERWRDPYALVLEDTRIGPIEIALDMALAHEGEGPDFGLDPRLAEGLRERLGEIGSLWLPVEIALPPLAYDRLEEVDTLVADLRRAGAKGTGGGLLSAFGLQLNVELARLDADYILSHLRAFLLLSEPLRQAIGVDLKRRLTPFIDPFPESYARQVLSADYAPDLPQLIDDYLAANPTRNRELDLLPLFSEIDRARVAQAVPSSLVRARPAFHYRLPDSRVDDPHWSVTGEWNRWLMVEWLALDRRRLKAAAADYLSASGGLLPRDWRARLERWLP